MEVSEEQFELPAHLSHNGSSIGRLNSLLNAPTGTSEGPKLQAPRSFTIIGAAYRGDISLHGALQDVFSARWNDAIEIVPVDRIELNRFQRAGNSNDLLCRERDQIWIAAHETEEFSVGGYRRDVRRAQDTSTAGSLRPMQYGATGKMSPATDQRHVREELLSLSIPKLNRWIRTHNPAVVSGMKVDRDTAECAAPFHHRGIEVRMRDGDCLQAAKTIDQGNGRRVKHRNAVPQDISIGCANNERALADRKGRLRPNADHSRLVLAV